MTHWAALTGRPETADLSPEEIVDRIVAAQNRIESFWSNARGWAPDAAADLLDECRLDRQVSLAECLRLWIVRSDDPGGELSEGELILGWANLGSLVESTLKLLLVVFFKDYLADDQAPRRKGNVQPPPDVSLERVRQFFMKRRLLTADLDSYVLRVQRRRNAIHSLRQRDIGSAEELLNAVRHYLKLVEHIEGSLPAPFHPPW